MNTKTNGSGAISVLFSLLFVASVILNIAFLTGCENLPKHHIGQRPQNISTYSNDARIKGDLLGIATELGLSSQLSDANTTDEIIYTIKQTIRNTKAVPRDAVFGEKELSEICYILSPDDSNTLKKMNNILKDAKGKRILILENY